MVIHFTRSPKIRRAPTKTVVSAFVTTNTGKETYYGYIEDIWELNYGSGDLKVPLFRCKWVNMTRGGVTSDPQYGMTTVDLNNLAYADEPFVLANDVARVFYVRTCLPSQEKEKKRK